MDGKVDPLDSQWSLVCLTPQNSQYGPETYLTGA